MTTSKDMLKRLEVLEQKVGALQDRKEPSILFLNGEPVEPGEGYCFTIGGSTQETVALSRLVFWIIKKLGMKLDVKQPTAKQIALK